jgi:hypothetical protein
MRRRFAALGALGVLSTLGLVGGGTGACVDLFHSTDFDTLCTLDPANEACPQAAPGDAGTADVVDATDEEAPRPRLDFCAWSTAEARTRAERACVWLGACEGPLGWTKLGSCMTEAILAYDCNANPSMRPQGKVDALWQCLAQVSSCDDVDACVFPGGLQQCEPLGAPGSFTACAVDANSDVLVECGDVAGGRPTGVAPCIGQSRTCAAVDPSQAACTGWVDPGCSTGNSCTGTFAIDCRPASPENIDFGFDCAGYGAGRCVKDLRGTQCTPDLAAQSCAGAFLECDGTTAFSCIDGRLAAVDCGKFGGTCDPNRTNIAGRLPIEACRAFAPGTTNPACGVADSCLSTSVRSCSVYADTPFEISCTRHGLGPCAVRANGNAACTPP